MKDPYIYENSDVLINKANLQDKKKLDEFENRMTNLALVLLYSDPITITTVHDIFKIHAVLFENVYSWAGNPRTINISKNEPILTGLSVEYTSTKEIINEINTLDIFFKHQSWNEMAKEDFVHIFTRFIAKLWQIHPFREGNTRTISSFAFLLLKQFGYHYNQTIIKENAKYFRNALVMASIKDYSEYHYLQKILTDVIDIQINKSSTAKYKTIGDYNVDEYEYEYHKLKTD